MASETIRMRLLLSVIGFLLLHGGRSGALVPQAAEAATRLVSSQAVVLNSRTGKVYAVDPAQNAVVVFDSAKRAGLRVAVGAEPVAIAVNEVTNRVYVANAGGETVSVIDGESNAVRANVKVGPRPYALAANSATNKIYVSIAFGDTITVIDGSTDSTSAAKVGNADAIAVDAKLNKIYLLGYEDTNLTMVDSAANVVGKVASGIHLWGMAVNESAHMLYATRSGNAELVALDELSGKITIVPVGAIPCAVAVNPATNMVYVVNHGDDTVTVVDGAKNTAVATLHVGKQPQGIAVDPLKNLVYIANKHGDTVSVIDGRQNRVVKTIQTEKNPYALAVDPRSGLVYVALVGPTAIEVIDPAKLRRPAKQAQIGDAGELVPSYFRPEVGFEEISRRGYSPKCQRHTESSLPERTLSR
jgi:YVTN family beta-propeller protein